MKKLHFTIISASLACGIIVSLILNYYDFFTPVTNENTYGIKAQVKKWPPSWDCPNICPEYEISLSAQKDVAVTEVYICKVLCVKQDGMVLNVLRMSYANTAIKSSFVPWQVGDGVDIRLKVAPVHMDGGISYSDYEAKMLDLGVSEVTAG